MEWMRVLKVGLLIAMTAIFAWALADGRKSWDQKIQEKRDRDQRKKNKTGYAQ
jgi:hypothetical protein